MIWDFLEFLGNGARIVVYVCLFWALITGRLQVRYVSKEKREVS